MIKNATRLYFDNAASTPLSAVAREAMSLFLGEAYGNASSPYALGRDARMAIDSARAAIAQLIGAAPDEVAFTSGGTESDNWALLGVALANFENRDSAHIIVSSVEHHAVIETAGTLRALGFEVEEARCDENGIVSLEEVERLLRQSTLLVSVMAVNNETGTMQPAEEIGALCRERGVLYHCDAVQAAGKIPLDVNAIACDLLTVSSHKIHGPKGAGALYIRRGTKTTSLLRGGGQERGRRGGTENVAAIAGFGAAAKEAVAGLGARTEYLMSLRLHLENGLREMGAVINSENAPRGPHIVNISLPGQRAETLALNLDLQGVAVGTGSACASGAIEPSHVLTAMGFDSETARACLRISLGAQNTREEADEVLEILTNLIHHRGTETQS